MYSRGVQERCGKRGGYKWPCGKAPRWCPKSPLRHTKVARRAIRQFCTENVLLHKGQVIKEVWWLELEGDAEKTEAPAPWSGLKGVSVNPEGESCHGQAQAKMARKERESQTQNGRDG